MIDFITSKLGLLIAAMLMLAMLGSLLHLMNSTAEQKGYQRVADDLASILSQIDGSPGEMNATLVFDHSDETLGIHFPRAIGGESYTISLYTGSVVIYDADGGYRAQAHISGEVHGWTECEGSNPTVGLSSQNVTDCDGEEPWTFPTRQTLILEVNHEIVLVDSEEILLTLVRRK